VHRIVRRLQKIRECLGGDTNVFTRFPERPKNLHLNTYRRLREKAERLEERMCDSIFAGRF